MSLRSLGGCGFFVSPYTRQIFLRRSARYAKKRKYRENYIITKKTKRKKKKKKRNESEPGNEVHVVWAEEQNFWLYICFPEVLENIVERPKSIRIHSLGQYARNRLFAMIRQSNIYSNNTTPQTGCLQLCKLLQKYGHMRWDARTDKRGRMRALCSDGGPSTQTLWTQTKSLSPKLQFEMWRNRVVFPHETHNVSQQSCNKEKKNKKKHRFQLGSMQMYKDVTQDRSRVIQFKEPETIGIRLFEPPKEAFAMKIAGGSH